MTKLLDLSGKIDETTLGLYEVLTKVASSLDTPFFLVGATARDMILEQGFGIGSRRATRDIDFGVRVSDWDKFHRLRQALLNSGRFAETREIQRLRYRGELLVDIVPFGEIANPNREISWPPDQTIVMSTVGFEEAYAAAQRVRVRANPPLEILVASLAGLAIMKIVAWADRPQVRSNDAGDLALVLETYLDAGNYRRLLEQHDDLVAVEDFDYVRAGARLLGRDIARIASLETKAKIQQILRHETAEKSEYLLVNQIVRASTLTGEEERRVDEVVTLLRELSKGMDESHPA